MITINADVKKLTLAQTLVAAGIYRLPTLGTRKENADGK